MSHENQQAAQSCVLSGCEAQTLEEESWSCVPKLFEDLKGSRRPLLMEVCCTPESILSEVVQKLEGHSGAAVRCSLFNGCDLSQGSGVKLVLERIRLERPRNVWISPPCDPFSPLQHLNSRTEEQRRELEEKRQHAQKVYVGASVIFRFCVEQGIHCTWEWAERCEAWRLPIMQKLRKSYSLHEAVTQGCRVNLRTKLEQRLMRKGWRIVTTHERLAQVMARPCRCPAGTQHDQCTGQDTARTGLYTKEYARLVHKALKYELNHHAVLQECLGVTSLLPGFGEGETCTCGEFHHSRYPMSCGSCLMGRAQVQNGHHCGPQVFSEGRNRLEAEQRKAKQPPKPKPSSEAEQLEAKQQCEAKQSPKRKPSSEAEQREAKEPPKPKPSSEAKQCEAKQPPKLKPSSEAQSLAEAKLKPNQVPQVSSPQAEPQQVSQAMSLHQADSYLPEPKDMILSCRDAEEREPIGMGSPTEDAWPAEASSEAKRLGCVQNKQDEEIKRKLYLLHAATGHGSIRHLLDALRRRQVEPRVLELAKQFRCSICEEKGRVHPRHLASLEPLPPKWATVSADIGHWYHPKTGEHSHFMLIIDEGSRFRAARILGKGSKQSPNAATCLQYFREGWTQYFGVPQTLRLDPAGAFRSQQVEAFCDRHGIYLDLIPGEAHWKIGACEQAVQGTKELMTKLVSADEDMSVEELLSQAIMTFNQRDIIRGFSPVQHALGQCPDEQGRMVPGPQNLPPEMLVESADGEFAPTVERRAAAERAHADGNAKQRLQRASQSKARPCYDYQPGELVYFWRTQEANKSRRSPGGKQGRFLGPARILATETRREKNGHLLPGSAIWLVRGRSLLKCSPEQLRRASPREELVEAMTPEAKTPWTFTRVASELGGNRYQDISGETQPTRHRIRHKRPEPASEDEELIPDAEDRARGSGDPTPLQRPRLQSQPTMGSGPQTGWWSEVSESEWPQEQASCFWHEESAAVSIELEMPESHRQWKVAMNDLEGFFVGALKRQAIEVSEKRLTPEDREKFRLAKGIEVKNFVAAKAFEALPEHLKPHRDEAVSMRWILTWKSQDNGTAKAKARAVLLGFQDPLYEHRATTAPVMTRQSRQMLLQMSANKGWQVQKGDVSGAFLRSARRWDCPRAA